MHNFETKDGYEITVAHPQTGELLVGNSVQAWQPVSANKTDELMVLTQQGSGMPLWQSLSVLPVRGLEVCQPAIPNPLVPAMGFSALAETQALLREILNVLRHYELIGPETSV